jgi:glutamine synthetase
VDFRRQAITLLEQMGISVEFSHHEGGPGQQEIDLRYADALTTADNLMTFRLVVQEVALEQGLYASFMPKPLRDHPGSGMHTHLSLFEGDRNAFFEAGAEFQLSKVARSFIAGLLVHAPEITAVTNQWVNSYKRLAGGAEAPAWICWGHNNRSSLIRVPMYKPAKGNSTRIEFRSLDSAANPYLAFAVLLAAGLKGIEEGYELPRGGRGRRVGLTDVGAPRDGHEAKLPGSPQPRAMRRRWKAIRAGRRDPRASMSSTTSCATSGPSGPSTGTRSPSSSSTDTCPGSDRRERVAVATTLPP